MQNRGTPCQLRAETAMQAHRIGIIGLGKIAQDQHIPVIGANPAFELVAVASQRGLAVDGVPHAVRDYRRLLELPAVEASVYLKAMDRQRWAFPQVGVAAARVAGQVRLGLAGVAPIPWLLTGPDALDAATPLPRTAWKVDVARALVRRALDRL